MATELDCICHSWAKSDDQLLGREPCRAVRVEYVVPVVSLYQRLVVALGFHGIAVFKANV